MPFELRGHLVAAWPENSPVGFPVALEVCADLHADVALAIIQIAHEGPGVLGSVVLANPPLKFADNRLQELLHFDGLAF